MFQVTQEQLDTGSITILRGPQDEIPYLWVTNVNLRAWNGISQINKEIILSGPEHKDYWQAWEDTLTNHFLIDQHGNWWLLHHQGETLTMKLETL